MESVGRMKIKNRTQRWVPEKGDAFQALWFALPKFTRDTDKGSSGTSFLLGPSSQILDKVHMS